MNLAGIPPMSGFLGKVGLLQAGLDLGSPLAITLVAGGVVTSLLTLYAVAKTWTIAFWRTPEQAHETAQALPIPGAEADAQHPTVSMIRHRGHVHVGGTAYAAQDLEEARRVRDEDAPDRDLYQLIRDDELPDRLPLSMTLPTAALVAFSLTFTLVAGPLFGYTDRTAADLERRTPYLEAVLDGRSG
jgi:multicomponent Na+:H+ antiporter subunit D